MKTSETRHNSGDNQDAKGDPKLEDEAHHRDLQR